MSLTLVTYRDIYRSMISSKEIRCLLCPAVWELFFKKAISRNPLHESVSPKQTFLPCGSVLCASLTCATVAVCPCVWGCLFCLPLSIALSCPFLPQLEKGTTPLSPWPSACVWCLALLGFLLQSLILSNIYATPNTYTSALNQHRKFCKSYDKHKGTQAYTYIIYIPKYVYICTENPHLSTHTTISFTATHSTHTSI